MQKVRKKMRRIESFTSHISIDYGDCVNNTTQKTFLVNKDYKRLKENALDGNQIMDLNLQPEHIQNQKHGSTTTNSSGDA